MKFGDRRWLVALAAVAAMFALPVSARAGQWVQVSCVNPNGSAAPSDGWSQFATGNPGAGSTTTRCGPGAPMQAKMDWIIQPPYTGSSEVLQYSPPPGSTVVGGSLSVDLDATAVGNGTDTAAGVYEPVIAPGGLIKQCSPGFSPCPNNEFTGTVALPPNQAGDVFVQVICAGASGSTCSAPGRPAPYYDVASASVYSSQVLMSNDAAPVASQFSGGLLAKEAHGTAGLVFTAGESGGPGIYNVTVRIGRKTVYSGTPDSDSGRCVPVGASGGALMFDWQQPCPSLVDVHVPVNTRRLHDGRHRLRVSVTDAAGNTSVVLDQTIRTLNRGSILQPRRAHRRHVDARITIRWHWPGRHARIASIAFARLPRGAVVTVACYGSGCPASLRSAQTSTARTTAGLLDHRQFLAGDRVYLTISAPRRSAERALIRIRAGKLPSARLLSDP